MKLKFLNQNLIIDRIKLMILIIKPKFQKIILMIKLIIL